MRTPVRPKKALGQHFLRDQHIAERIARSVLPAAGEPVLEVGPGMGVLTRYLLELFPGRVTAAEIDSESIEYLMQNFPEFSDPTSGDRLISGDFLEMNLNEIFPGDGKFCVIGNYPYNISSQIFFKVLDYKDRISCCSGMLQREVAERIAAPAGGKTRGILSVLIQAWYDVEYLFTVDENVFNPPPKVKSGVIRLTRNSVSALGCDERLFRTVVKTAFGQRRKTLRNSLKPLIQNVSHPEGLLAKRPEQLSVHEFVELTKSIESAK